MPVPILLIAAAAAAAAKGISGAVQAKKAKNEAAKLAASRPTLPNNQFAQDQLSFAENELSRSSQTGDQYNQGVDRDLSNSIGAILKGGGDINSVGELFDSTNQGRQRARLMSENIRMNNIQNYVRASQGADNARQQQFQFNDWAPWADNAQANAQARVAANQKTWQAVDEFGSLALRAGAGQNPNPDPAPGSHFFMSDNQLNSSTVNGVSNYNAPSVANQFGRINPDIGTDVGQNSIYNRFQTIDPNSVTNWSVNQ